MAMVPGPFTELSVGDLIFFPEGDSGFIEGLFIDPVTLEPVFQVTARFGDFAASDFVRMVDVPLRIIGGTFEVDPGDYQAFLPTRLFGPPQTFDTINAAFFDPDRGIFNVHDEDFFFVSEELDRLDTQHFLDIINLQGVITGDFQPKIDALAALIEARREELQDQLDAIVVQLSEIRSRQDAILQVALDEGDDDTPSLLRRLLNVVTSPIAGLIDIVSNLILNEVRDGLNR